MSQCKRPCVVSFMSANIFTYSFGDLDPEDAEHIDAVTEFTVLYGESNEVCVLRD